MATINARALDFAAGAAAAAAVAGIVTLIARRRSTKDDGLASSLDVNASTTSSAQGFGVYETDKAVAEYLMFHFGAAKDLLPYGGDIAPHNALEFASRTAAICSHWARKLNLPLKAAFDVGCAVGRTSFDLSRDFERVVGLDFSHAFIAAADRLKVNGSAEYTCTVEGETVVRHVARVPEGVHAERIAFRQGDACALPTAQELGGRFTVIHGANLLCRLPDPMLFLRRLPSLLLPGGLVVFISPYSWLKQYTPRDKWLGGRIEGDGTQSSSAVGVTGAMEGLGFKLVHQEDCPFLIREHVRKYQWGCSHVTVWQLQQ